MNINNPTTFGTPNLTLATANSSGTGGALRSDDSILVFDTTLPANIIAGSASVGSASTVTRRDHVHSGSPALTTLAKVWCNWEMTGAHSIRVSYNYTSVTDGGLGITDHVIDTDFSSGNYVLTFGGVDAPCMFLAGGTQAAGIYKTFVENGEDGTRLDSTAAQLVGFGAQ